MKAILVLAETRMRASDFSSYERKLERKSQMLMKIAERKRKDEERGFTTLLAQEK